MDKFFPKGFLWKTINGQVSACDCFWRGNVDKFDVGNILALSRLFRYLE